MFPQKIKSITQSNEEPPVLIKPSLIKREHALSCLSRPRGLRAAEARPGQRRSMGHAPAGGGRRVWRVAGLRSCPQHQVVQKVGDFWTEGPRGRRARTLAGVGRLSSPARRGPRLQGLVGALATVEASGAQHASVSSPPSTCRALAGGRGGVLCPLTLPARLGSSSAPTSSPEPWGLGIGRSKGLAWPSQVVIFNRRHLCHAGL